MRYILFFTEDTILHTFEVGQYFGGSVLSLDAAVSIQTCPR